MDYWPVFCKIVPPIPISPQMKRLILTILTLTAFSAIYAQVNPPTPSFPINNAPDMPATTRLRWSTSNATTYEYAIDTSANFDSPLLKTGPAYSYVDLKYLRYNTTYYWKARGWKNSDSSVWTATRKFTTLGTFAFTYPNHQPNRNINYVIPVKRTGGMLVMEYDTSALFNSPALQIDTIGDTTIVETLGATSAITLSNLYFGKTHYARGHAFHVNDTLAANGPYDFTTRAIPNIASPYTAGGYDVSPELRVVPFLDPRPGDTISKYQFQVDTSTGFNSPLLREYINSDYTMDEAEILLHYDKTYYARARAWSIRDTSAWTSPVMFTTKKDIRFYDPFFTDTIIRTDIQPLRTEPMQKVIRFELMVDTAADFSSAFVNDTMRVLPSGSSKAGWDTLRDLRFNTRYYFQVRSITAEDTSEWTQNVVPHTSRRYAAETL